MLGVKESFDKLKGLPMAKWRLVTKHEDLRSFGFPCFLKADVSGHKTEMGAVLKCDNLEDAEKNLKKIHKMFPKNPIIVQEIFSGIEMIIGLKEDEVFGKLLVVGFGGIFAEANKDVSFRALPVSREDIVSMVKNLRGFEIFSSRVKYNLEKFYTLVEKVAYLGDKTDIRELDLNPVIVGERDSKIIDARVG
jgi:hypothetical protein